MRAPIRLALLASLTVALFAPALADPKWGRIVYQGEMLPGQRGLFVMDADGERAVMIPPSATISEMITPALSPFGNRLAFAGHAPDQPFKIYVWDLTLDNQPIGEPQPVTFGDAHDEQPAWSPDAAKLVFIRSTGGEHWLMLITLGSPEEARLAPLTSNFRDAYPQWAPSGDRILFSNEGSLWEADLNGDVQLLRAGVSGAAYSPDGQRLAYFARDGAMYKLFVVPHTGGGEPRLLLSDIGGAGEVSWGPDGNRLVFKASEVKKQPGNLWIINDDGSDMHPSQIMGLAHGYVQWTPHPQVFQAAQEQAPTVTADSPIRIVNPAPGSTVQGTVPVRIATTDPAGYVSIRLDDEFVYATAEPYTWDWDTSRVSEGRHTLVVDAFNGSRQHLGRSTMTVQIANRLTTNVPEEVLLRMDFRRGEQSHYHISGLGIVPRDHPLATERNRVVGAWIRASLFTQVSRIAADNSWARLDNRYDDGWWRFGNVTTLLQGSRVVQTEVPPTGLASQPGGGMPRTTAVPMAWPSITFPDAPVAPGDEWEAPMVVVPIFHANRPVLVPNAKHRFTGFVHYKGFDTVEIVSTYDLPPTVVDLSGRGGVPGGPAIPSGPVTQGQPPGPKSGGGVGNAPVGLDWGSANAQAGGPSPAGFTAGSPMGPPRPTGASSSAAPRPPAASTTTAGTAARAAATTTRVAEQVPTQVTRIILAGKGERRTYFAWKIGKIIAIEETMTGTLKSADAGGAPGAAQPPGQQPPGPKSGGGVGNFPVGIDWGSANARAGGPSPAGMTASAPGAPPRPTGASAGAGGGRPAAPTGAAATGGAGPGAGQTAQGTGAAFETPYIVSYIIERAD